jgi:hypothetical protein
MPVARLIRYLEFHGLADCCPRIRVRRMPSHDSNRRRVGMMLGDLAIWIGLAELRGLPGSALLSDSAGAFTSIVTWATDADAFRTKVETLAKAYSLFVVRIESEEPVAARKDRGALHPGIEELVYQAESNPKAILFGTLHKYRFDEA